MTFLPWIVVPAAIRRGAIIIIVIPILVLGFGVASLWLLAHSLTYPEAKGESFINYSTRACVKACSVFVNLLGVGASLYPIWTVCEPAAIQQQQGGRKRCVQVLLQCLLRTLSVLFLAAALALLLSIHHYWVTTGLQQRNLTRELMLIISIFVPNAVYAIIWCTLYVMATAFPPLTRCVVTEVCKKKNRVQWRRLFLLVAIPSILILLFMTSSSTHIAAASSLMDYPNIFSLESTVTGKQFVHSCSSSDEPVELPTPWIAYTPLWVRRLVSGRSGCDLTGRRTCDVHGETRVDSESTAAGGE